MLKFLQLLYRTTSHASTIPPQTLAEQVLFSKDLCPCQDEMEIFDRQLYDIKGHLPCVNLSNLQVILPPLLLSLLLLVPVTLNVDIH